MSGFSRKRILVVLAIVLLLAVGGWFYSQRVPRVAMETYVPESALGYLEFNNLPQFLGHFTSTKAWRQLAPTYDLSDKLSYLGRLGMLARWSGVGSEEAVMLARAQLAVVVTGIEVRGEEVKPRLAVIAETHSREDRLRAVIESRLPQLAARVYRQAIREATEYGGVPVSIYRTQDKERRLLSAQMGSLWILANHPDPLRACIDTRLGRTPSIANNFYLRRARPRVEGSGDLFAFVSGPGVARLLQFGAHLVSGGAISSTPFASALQDLLADISSRASDGIAYGASFENGIVVDRYALMFKPQVVDHLKATIKVNQGHLRTLGLVPAGVREVTVVNVEDPSRALDGIEAAISSQVGAGQSFLLHRFLLSAREALFGLKAGESAAPAIGNELASFGFSEEMSDRVLLVAVRDRALLVRFVERYLSQRGASIEREKYRGVEIISSSDHRRGAAAFIGDFLALGARAPLRRLTEAREGGQSLQATPQFAASSRPSQPAAILSFSSVKGETREMMMALTRWLQGQSNGHASTSALDQLPLAASATSLAEDGIFIESHAPLGNFPFFVSLAETTMNE
jgi:hypothetical protein